MDNINLDWLGNILNSGADAYVKVKGANALDDGNHNGTIPLDNFGGGAGGGGINPAILLLGAGLVMFMFLKD